MEIKGYTYGFGGKHGTLLSEDATYSRDCLYNTGINWMCLAVCLTQDTFSSTEIHFDFHYTPTDAELTEVIRQAHEKGVKVCLKPMVNSKDGVWRAQIDFPDEDMWGADPYWSKWFESYTWFMLHYAELAKQTGCEMLCIGCEMCATERKEAYWRKLIEQVRGVYDGPLVYNTNHGNENKVKWFDCLDYIGTSAYYRVTEKAGDDLSVMQKSWERVADRLGPIAEKLGKKIIFMEIGCRSALGCASMPWDFTHKDFPVSEQEQADFYESALSVFSQKEWFAGFFWWDWSTTIYRTQEAAAQDKGFNIHRKKAERIMTEWYKRLSCLLLVCLLSVLGMGMSGCALLGIGEEETPDAVTATPVPITPDTTVMRIGGKAVKMGEIALYFRNFKSETESLYTQAIWSQPTDKDKTPFDTVMRQDLCDKIVYLKTVCAQANVLGISLTEDDTKDVEEYTADYLALFSKDELTEYGITADIVRQIYTDNVLANKIFESLTLNVDTENLDEEARCIKLVYVYRSKTDYDVGGSPVALTDDEIESVRRDMAEIRTGAKGMSYEDFLASAEALSDNRDETEIIVRRGEMLYILEKAAFALKTGQYSEVLETENGFFLFYCVSNLLEEETEANKLVVIREKQDLAFAEKYKQWVESTTVEIYEDIWNTIDFTDY